MSMFLSAEAGRVGGGSGVRVGGSIYLGLVLVLRSRRLCLLLCVICAIG